MDVTDMVRGMLAALETTERVLAQVRNQIAHRVPSGAHRRSVLRELEVGLQPATKAIEGQLAGTVETLLNENAPLPPDAQMRVLQKKLTKVLQAISNLERMLPGAFDACEVTYDVLWKLRAAIHHWPLLDQAKIANARKYFDGGGKGLSIEEMMDDL